VTATDDGTRLPLQGRDQTSANLRRKEGAGYSENHESNSYETRAKAKARHSSAVKDGRRRRFARESGGGVADHGHALCTRSLRAPELSHEAQCRETSGVVSLPSQPRRMRLLFRMNTCRLEMRLSNVR
jgi:hypothetical protein